MAKSRNKSLTSHCGVAIALQQFGDEWTLMILRNAFHGFKRFDEMEHTLGIATNVLADRLRRLTENGILDKTPMVSDKRRFEYHLTDKGLDIYPIFIALNQWGERWSPDEQGDRMELIEKASGEPIADVCVRSKNGQALQPRDVYVKPGPGASKVLRALIEYRSPKNNDNTNLQELMSDA